MPPLKYTCDKCGETIMGITLQDFKKIVETRNEPCGCHKMSKEDQAHNLKFIEFWEKENEKN